MATGTSSVPVGAAALHGDWPEARFNVSGMFVHHPMIFQFCQLLEKGFDCRAPIEALHGAPNMPWNAGRHSRTPFNLADFVNVLETLNTRGVGYFATFTNHLVDEADLANSIGNQMLEHMSYHPDLNAVIITSELLSRYVRERFPDLRQIASITKVALEGGNGELAYYRELGRRFSRYVLHPDDCRNMPLLEQLDRDQAEIIVNENCVADCPTRPHHFDSYARMQKAASPMEEQLVRQEIKEITAQCESPIHPWRYGGHRRTCNLTRDEMKAAYDLGFRHFKLQGRSDDPYTYAYDLTRFLCEPQTVAPMLFKTLCRWLNQVVVKIKE